MKKIKYYKIGYSINPKIVGNLESVKNSQIVNFVDPENNSVEHTSKYSYIGYEHLPDGIDMSLFKFDDKAKQTDLLSSVYFNGYGFFVSEKFNSILNDYKVNNVKIFEATVSKVSDKTIHSNYFLLGFIESSEIINFEKSFFYADNSLPILRKTEKDIIPVKSYKDYGEKVREVWLEKGFGNILIPIKIILNETVDFVQFPFDSAKFISESLKFKLEKENIIGVEFEESEIEFYVE